jgi:hypothetical protein
LNLPLHGAEHRNTPQWAVEATRKSREQKFRLLSGETNPEPLTTINVAYLDRIEKVLQSKKLRLYYHLNKYWLHSSIQATEDHPTKSRAGNFFTRRKYFYENTFSKYDDDDKLYLSSKTFVTVD